MFNWSKFDLVISVAYYLDSAEYYKAIDGVPDRRGHIIGNVRGQLPLSTTYPTTVGQDDANLPRSIDPEAPYQRVEL